MLFEPRLDLGAAEAKHVGREPETGQLAGTPPTEDAWDREPEELGDLASGEQAVARHDSRQISIATG